MQIDEPVLLTLAGAIGGAIATLFWQLLKAKDAHIAELRETIRYQRSVGELAQGTAHRAVDVLGRSM